MNEEDKKNPLNRLFLNYDTRIHEKIELIKKLCQQVKDNPSNENLASLKNEVHKIGGNAGTYGYPKVTEICRALEQDLRSLLESTGSENEFPDLDLFMQEFTTRFQPHTHVPQKDQALPKTVPIIYAVDDEHSFLEFYKNSTQSKFELRIETNPQQALAALSQPDFNPKAIIVKASYGNDTSCTGFQLIDTY